MTILSGPVQVDLVGVSGVEQVLGETHLQPGKYTEVRLQVTKASLTVGAESKEANVPSGELRLTGSFDIEASKTTTLVVDFDAGASLTVTGAGDVIVRPVAKLVIRPPSATPPPVEFPALKATGLIATLPGYTTVDLSEAADLAAKVYPGRTPRSIQALVMVTEDDQAYLVIALDAGIDRFITAGTVAGRRAPPLKGVPPELDFAGRVVVADSLALMQPVKVTPDQVNKDPARYAFQRVVMDTTYVFSGVRVKDAPQGLKHIGFGLATDHLGSPSRDDYLTIVDPYNTETQIRVPQLYGTVLYATQAARLLLRQVYALSPRTSPRHWTSRVSSMRTSGTMRRNC